MDDVQVNVLEAEHRWFWRRAEEVAAPDGLQRASTFDISFEPSFEDAEIHYVRVVRDGVARDALQLEGLQLLRRERDLERGIYNGEVTAHLVIPDLRVGDVVETAYSLRRSHPVLKGRFGTSITFQFSRPLHDIRFRLLAPSSRRLAIRDWGAPPQPELVEHADGVLERKWRAVGVEPLEDEPEAPLWWRRWASIRIGDDLHWAEVADVFRPLYADDGALPGALETAAAEIEAAEPVWRERAAAALRYVQSTNRYLAVGIGEGGYAPRPLAHVTETRAGDCKDASRLLCALLRRLGFSAEPALVSTEADPHLDEFPAYILAFNHCLVRLRIDDLTIWLDGTRSPQGGRLDRLVQPRYGWALPLVPQAELEWMGEDALQTLVETHEVWTFGSKPSLPATLEVSTTHRGWRADEVRSWALNEGSSALAERWRGFYEREYGEVVERAPLTLRDELSDNELFTIEVYSVTRPWAPASDAKHVVFSTADDIVGPTLQTPETPRRQDAIDLGGPRRFQTTRVFHLPREVTIQPWSDKLEGPGVLGRSVLDRLGPQKLRLDIQLACHRRSLMPEEAEGYLEFARKMRAANGMTLRLPVHGDRFGFSWSAKLWWLLILVLSYLVVKAVVGALPEPPA